MRLTHIQAQQLKRLRESPDAVAVIQAQSEFELGQLANAIELADIYRGQGRVQALAELLAMIQQD